MLEKVVNGRRVVMDAAEEAAIRAEWAASAAAPASKRPLARWAFRQIVIENGLEAAIQAQIAALPNGVQKRRAVAKLRDAQEFRADAPEMVALRAMMEAADPSFDFDALWAAGEALQFG